MSQNQVKCYLAELEQLLRYKDEGKRSHRSAAEEHVFRTGEIGEFKGKRRETERRCDLLERSTLQVEGEQNTCECTDGRLVRFRTRRIRMKSILSRLRLITMICAFSIVLPLMSSFSAHTPVANAHGSPSIGQLARRGTTTCVSTPQGSDTLQKVEIGRPPRANQSRGTFHKVRSGAPGTSSNPSSIECSACGELQRVEPPRATPG